MERFDRQPAHDVRFEPVRAHARYMRGQHDLVAGRAGLLGRNANGQRVVFVMRRYLVQRRDEEGVEQIAQVIGRGAPRIHEDTMASASEDVKYPPSSLLRDPTTASPKSTAPPSDGRRPWPGWSAGGCGRRGSWRWGAGCCR